VHGINVAKRIGPMAVRRYAGKTQHRRPIFIVSHSPFFDDEF